MEQLNKEIPFDLLVDYVEGLLSPEAAQRIEERAGQDEYYARIIDGIRYYFAEHGQDRSGLEAYLQNFQSRLFQKTVSPSRIRPMRTFLSRAAAVLLLIAGVAWVWRISGPGTNSQQLIEGALSEAYPNVYVLQKGEDEDSIRTQLGRLYDEQRYAELSQVLELFTEQLDSNAQAKDFFLLGLSYLYQDPANYPEAITSFEEAQSRFPDPSWNQQIQWHLALAKYQSGDRAAAKVAFETIAGDSGHYKQIDAEQILKKW